MRRFLKLFSSITALFLLLSVCCSCGHDDGKTNDSVIQVDDITGVQYETGLTLSDVSQNTVLAEWLDRTTSEGYTSLHTFVLYYCEDGTYTYLIYRNEPDGKSQVSVHTTQTGDEISLQIDYISDSTQAIDYDLTLVTLQSQTKPDLVITVDGETDDIIVSRSDSAIGKDTWNG